MFSIVLGSILIIYATSVVVGSILYLATTHEEGTSPDKKAAQHLLSGVLVTLIFIAGLHLIGMF